MVGCQAKEPDNYQEYVEKFTTVSAKDISNYDQIIVYIGNEDCPYCKKFIPKLYKASQETDVEIFTINLEKEDQDILSFLNKNEILHVPDLSIFRGGVVTEKFNTDNEDITIEDISNFIRNY